MSNYISKETTDVITYPCSNIGYNTIVKWVNCPLKATLEITVDKMDLTMKYMSNTEQNYFVGLSGIIIL